MKNGDNEFIITVSNSEGDSIDYKLIVKYDSADTDCDINTLEVEGYDIKFDPNVLEYKLKIKDEYSLKFIDFFKYSVYNKYRKLQFHKRGLASID